MKFTNRIFVAIIITLTDLVFCHQDSFIGSESFKAIELLHKKLDVDADGEVDDFESKRFLESNKNSGSTDLKLNYLHQDGKDRSISVNELWDAWTNSQVYNWTIEETIYWLVNNVELPEYSQVFEQNSINGTMFPRLATDPHFLSTIGITEMSAKSKISIKAMDVVLFGPPKMGNSSLARDIILSVVILVAISSCYVFYSRSITSQKALEAMQDNLEALQKAEDQMLNLQQELDKAVSSKKFSAPDALRELLQHTYNIESQYYNEKKLNLESQATKVKLRNLKLQKKKTSFLGYYKMAQENSLEDDINTIVEVKEAIFQMTREIKERSERWRAIEKLCGCSLEINR